MKLVCGSTVYGAGEEVGCLSGVMADGFHDCVVAILIQPRTGNGCLQVPFQQVLSAGEGHVESSIPAGAMTRREAENCQTERARMQRWLESLAEEDPGQDGMGGQFAVVTEEERGTFRLPVDRKLSISDCGCGAITEIDVDTQGYIRHVDIARSGDGRELSTMRPLAKRTTAQVMSGAKATLHLVS